MEKEHIRCPICGPLVAQMKESAANMPKFFGNPWNWSGREAWNGLPATARWKMPTAALNAGEHRTVCRYARCRRYGALYFAWACIQGRPVFRQVEDVGKENLNLRLWGRFGTCYLQKKG